MSTESREQAGDEGSDHDQAPEGDVAVGTEPLPTHWDDAAASLAESFLCSRTVRAPETADLTRFTHACLRYAYEHVSSKDKTYRELGLANGYRADYGHLDIILGKHAPDEVFPYLADWIDKHNRP